MDKVNEKPIHQKFKMCFFQLKISSLTFLTNASETLINIGILRNYYHTWFVPRNHVWPLRQSMMNDTISHEHIHSSHSLDIFPQQIDPWFLARQHLRRTWLIWCTQALISIRSLMRHAKVQKGCMIYADNQSNHLELQRNYPSEDELELSIPSWIQRMIKSSTKDHNKINKNILI